MGAARTSAADRPPSTGLALYDEPAAYLIVLDASGFDPEELSLETQGREITVRGEHPGDDSPLHARRRLEESFRIPDDADAEGISAVFKRGTLEIHVRREHVRRRAVPIERDHLGSTTPKGC